MASLLDVFLDIPAFLVSVYVLFWSVPLCGIIGQIKFWKFHGARDDPYGWGHGLQLLNGVKMLMLPGPQLYRGGPCLWLPNHRSWADFYLDVVSTEGRAQMLSRMMVAYVFPSFMFLVQMLKGVILFKRGKKFDVEAFNSMIDQQIAESPCEGLVVYPEGHRSTKRHSLPLKWGMLRYAYSRRLPVQIIMGSNKEAVVAEKHFSAHFGQKVLIGYSDVIHSDQFSTWEGFKSKVAEEWARQWDRIATADWSRAVPLPIIEGNNRDYPQELRSKVFAVTVVEMVIMVTVTLVPLLLLYHWARSSTFGAVVVALLAVWVAISLKRAFTPVFLPPPLPVGTGAGTGAEEADGPPSQIEPADESAGLLSDDSEGKGTTVERRNGGSS